MNDVIEEKYVIEYLLWDGSITQTEQEITNEHVMAKTMYNVKLDEFRCFIKSAKGFLYNPFSPRHNVNNRYLGIHWKWREVDEETLSQYALFVKTRNEVYYKHAERKARMG